MTQLALFPEPPAPGGVTIMAGSFWMHRWAKPGGYLRQIRVKSFDGQSAIVVPSNFVDEAWPWTGRTLTAAQLRKDWTMITRRRP